MGKFKGTERITNEDGSQLKVMHYTDKIVVNTKDPEGNYTGHVTDWFDNPGIHVTEPDGSKHWEGKPLPEKEEKKE